MTDSDSDSQESTPDFRTEDHRREQLGEGKEVVSASSIRSSATRLASPSSRTLPLHVETVSEEGPSRPASSSSTTHAESSEHHGHERLKFRGTDTYVDEIFTDVYRDELDDLELHRDMPLFLPPPQLVDPRDPSRPGSGSLWGVSKTPREFFARPTDVGDRPSPKNGVPSTIDVDSRVQATVERFHELKRQGIHYNQELMKNRSFNNPHVYTQLVELLDIDETRSNLPSLDTGRTETSWRSKFPLTPEELIEGDPISIEKRQRKEEETKRERKLRAGHNRTIDFDRARYQDDGERPSKRRSSGTKSTSKHSAR
ncbi:hypothetical protein PHSY_003013 [Pseudozyma hubeiensis SY62]|uniref:HCNGP-domain-containing protein n=1 Tax=Pseudozyma hubeiensis (strain SY62) TaxID=1305764 RepID=R9P2K0_PSEHS|nr:hypothetical protein PHSY_003013 [Pseudozyma hubeiensis SY62]GAC95437.1 hypothetical protein PHSY_003013 [Pseudozyma hubeiensis SY62]